jgi:hypothetical protein
MRENGKSNDSRDLRLPVCGASWVRKRRLPHLLSRQRRSPRRRFRPGDKGHPWNSLAAVNAHTFGPGDSISFARGSSYTGGFVVKDSGATGRPITFASYGAGAAPSFSNPDAKTVGGNVIQIKASYIVVDGLYFHDGPEAPARGNSVVLRTGAVFIDKSADHNVIRNCEADNTPIAINVQGEYNLISRNHLHDCTRFLRPPGWGPIAVLIGNSNNEIAYNHIENYVATGGRYGADGGALEIDSRLYGLGVRDVSIHHNQSYGNEGFLEVESSKAADRINVSYNVSNDYQQFIFFWAGTNSVVENNTVLRVLPKNSVTDVVFSFKQPGNTIRNNIFVVNSKRQVFSDNGTEVYKMGDYSGQKRQNNLYYSVDGTQPDPCGLPLAESEKIADPRFADYEKQDYHLTPGNPAIDAGFDNGSATDLDGKKVPAAKARDIGAYEFGGMQPTNRKGR